MTVNLEEILLKENRKLATPKELLFIREFETNTELVENDALERVGMNRAVKKGKNISDHVTRLKQQTDKFKQERVFHVSQIRSLCKKYHLRFLPSEKFTGQIDKQLPTKITNFEAAYNVKCSSYNTKICAPADSFELQVEPKDPLFFYAINDEYYYLIHKWGNDLSVFRRVLPMLSNEWVIWFIASFIFPLPLLTITLIDKKVGVVSYLIISLFIGLVIAIQNAVCFDSSDRMRLVKKNKWESPYI